MQAKIYALHANLTWEYTTLPHGVILIGSKWVFKIKIHQWDVNMLSYMEISMNLST